MKETFAAARSLLTGPAPTLFGSRNRPKAKSDFWVTFIDLLPVVMSAGAILVDPSGRADLGGFPGAVNRLMIPFEVLTVEEDALEFLRQFVPLREKEDPEQ